MVGRDGSGSVGGGRAAADRLASAWRRPRRAPAPRAATRAEAGPVHGGKLVARALADRGVSKLFTLSGGHLFSIYDGCVAEGIDIDRHPPRAGRGLGGRGLREGDPQARHRRADRRPRRHQRDERDGRREVQPLAAGRARRPRAGDALGLGLAPGDRPPAVRLAGDQAGRDGEVARRLRRGTARAIDEALRGPTGPTYVDFPLDVVFMRGRGRAGAEAGVLAWSRPRASRRPPPRWAPPSARW